MIRPHIANTTIRASGCKRCQHIIIFTVVLATSICAVRGPAAVVPPADTGTQKQLGRRELVPGALKSQQSLHRAHGSRDHLRFSLHRRHEASHAGLHVWRAVRDEATNRDALRVLGAIALQTGPNRVQCNAVARGFQ